MNDQSQIIAIAELDGWRFIPSHDVGSHAVPESWENEDGSNTWDGISDFDDYLNQYDAIIPVIAKQQPHIKSIFGEHLARMLGYWENSEGWNMNEDSFSIILQSTPKQLSEALLRATGKWKD